MPTKKIGDLRELLVQKLRSLYDVESELVDALPTMAESATDGELRAAFESHLEETKGHVERLERAFEEIGEEASKTSVDAIRGIVDDAESGAGSAEGAVRDALLIAAGSSAEHYEMAGYMAAIRWAQELGEDKVATMLQETLDEEEAADAKLASIAAHVDAEDGEEE